MLVNRSFVQQSSHVNLADAGPLMGGESALIMAVFGRKADIVIGPIINCEQLQDLLQILSAPAYLLPPPRFGQRVYSDRSLRLAWPL